MIYTISDNEVVAVLVQFQGENIPKTVINITQRHSIYATAQIWNSTQHWSSQYEKHSEKHVTHVVLVERKYTCKMMDIGWEDGRQKLSYSKASRNL